MPAKVLATRIELFRALCEDIKNNAGRGSLTSAEIQALRDDLLAAGNECELTPYAKGMMNQAYAYTSRADYHLSLTQQSEVSPPLKDTIVTLCEVLDELEKELAASS